jgi:hypothetical protein
MPDMVQPPADSTASSSDDSVDETVSLTTIHQWCTVHKEQFKKHFKSPMSLANIRYNEMEDWDDFK